MLSSKDFDRGIPWTLLAIEALLIVLSVLLALGLNNWREGRAHQELALRSVQAVMDEAGENCARIGNLHGYHRAVADREQETEGLRIGFIRNDAWESARATGAAAHIDYDVAAVMGRIYSLQDDHRVIVQSYAQALLGFAAGSADAETLHGELGELDVVVIRELVRTQDDLLEAYRELRDTVTGQYGRRVNFDGFCS